MQESSVLRSTDRSVGKIICFFLSIIHWLIGPTSKKTILASKQKVLLIELFEMGSSIMIAPSIRFAQKTDPTVDIHVLTTTTCSASWEALGLIKQENIHAVKSASSISFLIDLFVTVLRLRAQVFDVVIDYGLFMRISAIVSGLLRTRRRCGFYRGEMEGLYRGGFFSGRCVFNQNSHIALNFLALTRA